MERMMRVLITGATGFVGQHVARRLAATEDVTVLARNPAKARQILGDGNGISIAEGDFRDLPSLEKAFAGVDVLYHLGAARDHWGRPYSWYYDSNVTGTRNVLTAAEHASIPKIVYCSTVGVYSFDFQYRPVDEAHPYGRHFSFYHGTKKMAEELVMASSLPIITVRPGWIYGPNDDAGGVTQMLLKLSRGKFAFVGKGENRIHPVFIDDVVNGILAAGRSDCFGEAFLLLGPEALTFDAYVRAMCDALEVDPPRLHIPYGLALLSCYGLEPLWLAKNRLFGKQLLGDKPPMTRDTLHGVTADRVYDTSKGERMLGHRPRVTVREGLARTVDWLVESGRLEPRRAQPLVESGAR
jgi:nucleoside-diphosphate-sugar epimerase